MAGTVGSGSTWCRTSAREARIVDEERIDRLTKAVARGGLSRRTLLRGVGGGLVAALLGEKAEARRRDGSRRGTSGADGSNANGANGGNTSSASDANGANGGCTPNCTGKSCGSDGCGGTCGTCAGATCSTGSCQGGQCVLTPIPGCCTSDGDCDDGNPCTVDTCVDGTCQHAAAAPGTTCGPNQVCQDGSCIAACMPATCQAGQCGSTPDGCGGTLDCGMCGTGQTCANGTCVTSDPCASVTCTECQTCSGGGCVADASQNGAVCSKGTCQNGVCIAPNPCAEVACPPCQTCSNGTCVAANEGAYCGDGNSTCHNGQCVAGTPCAGGTATCTACQTCVNVNGGFCANVCTGGCKCPSTYTCDSQGICHPPRPRGCFLAGTRVAMADGTSKPIELVAPGDRVLGHHGVNRVRAVVRPVLGDRPLYALNGGSPFVTAGHPVLTESGWKAIDPAATAAEVPGLAVGRLAVGDRLLALAGVAVAVAAGAAGEDDPAEVQVEAMPLHRLTAHAADPTTPLFNLRVDGDHTYVANELLVHNKYY